MAAPETLAPVRDTFRKLAVAVVPEAVHLDEAGWAKLEEIVEEALSARPARIRRQVVLFLRSLPPLSVFRLGKSLRSLNADEAQRFFRGLERAPVTAVRRGFWGLRTLAFMGYYGRAAGRAALGYTASPAGWDARPADRRGWPLRGGRGAPEPSVRALLDDPGDPDA